MLHTRSINILTCISTRFDTQGFVDISPVVDHVLKFNPYVSGLFCTCGVVVIQCVLDISRYLFLINSHKMSRGSPIRTRYGVSLWIHSSCFLFLLFVLCATSGNIRPRYNEVSMVILLPPDHGDHPWVWDMVQGNYSLCGGRLAEGPRGVSKPRDGCHADRIALKFDRHSGSTSEVPVKFQSDWRNLNPSLADSRPRGVLGWGVGRPLLVNGGSRVGSDLLRWAQCCVDWSLG